jgi:hypothetical protein
MFLETPKPQRFPGQSHNICDQELLNRVSRCNRLRHRLTDSIILGRILTFEEDRLA